MSPVVHGSLLERNCLNGTVLNDKSRAYGLGEPSKPGCTFLTAATPSGLVVGGSWIDPVMLLDGTTLSPTGATTDYDIIVSKVEPAP